MLIHGQGSKLIRLLAFFPIFIGLFFGIYFLRYKSGFAGVMTLVFVAVAIWTLKARVTRIIDTTNQTYITCSNWLWMSWNNREPLSQFTHIAVIRSDINTEGSSSSTSYDLCLITSTGTQRIFEVFTVEREALARAEYIAAQTNLPVRGQ